MATKRPMAKMASPSKGQKKSALMAFWVMEAVSGFRLLSLTIGARTGLTSGEASWINSR